MMRKRSPPEDSLASFALPNAVLRQQPRSEARSTPDSAVTTVQGYRAPRWLEHAQRSIVASDEFRMLCREVMRRAEERKVSESFAEMSDAEQHNLLDDIYAQILEDGGSARRYELAVRSHVDAALSAAVTASRMAPTEFSLVETIERHTATGILSLLSSLPRVGSYHGAIQSLLGRALPRQLRVPLWTRRLEHVSAEEDFHRRQSADRLGMISADDASIAARCVALVGRLLRDIEPDALAAMKTALSSIARVQRATHVLETSACRYRHALLCRNESSFPDELFWLALPLVRVFSALENSPSDLARRIYIAIEAILEDGLKFIIAPAGSMSAGHTGDHLSSAMASCANNNNNNNNNEAKKTETEAAAIPWDEAPAPEAPVRSKNQDASPLALRLGISRATTTSTMISVEECRVPPAWAEHALQMLTSADPPFTRQLLDVAGRESTSSSHGRAYSDVDVKCFSRIVGRPMRTGLVQVLPPDAILFVWDQCILSSFSLCLPFAAATLLLCVRQEARELMSSWDGSRDADARLTDLEKLLDAAGTDASSSKFERLFRKHALPFIRATTARDTVTNSTTAEDISPAVLEAALPGWSTSGREKNLKQPELALADGGSFRPAGYSLRIDIQKYVSDQRPPEQGPELQHQRAAPLELSWPNIRPAKDELASIVDRVFEENSEAITYAHHLRRHSGGAADHHFDAALRREVAVAVARVLPCFAAMYERMPSAISANLAAVLDDSIIIEIPVKGDEKATRSALGEEPVAVTLAFPPNGDEMRLLRSPFFLCAAIVALRSSRGALWPRLRSVAREMADAAYETYHKQREIRAMASATHTLRMEIEEIANAATAVSVSENNVGIDAFANARGAKPAENDSPSETNSTSRAPPPLDAERAREKERAYWDAAENAVRASEAAVGGARAASEAAKSQCDSMSARIHEARRAEEEEERQATAAAEARERTIQDSVMLVQTRVYHHAFSKAELAGDAKLNKKYAKKYAKWVKEFRKHWESDATLRTAVPDAVALKDVIDAWAPP